MTLGTPRHGADLLSQHVPCHCFCMISASISLVPFFNYFYFCMNLHSCLGLGTVPCYASSLWVYDDSWGVRSVLPQSSC